MSKVTGDRKCVACNEFKKGGLFKRYQVACIVCQDNNVDYKTECATCGEIRSRNEFINANKCKYCTNKENSFKNSNINKSQQCIVCEVTKTKNLFRRNQQVCLECEKEPNISFDKKCGDCGETKNNSLFRVNSKKCIDCERAHGRNYRRTTTKASEWVENNREQMSKLQHDNYEKNKQLIRENEKERLKIDPHFRMIKSYRNTICKLISGANDSCRKLQISRQQYVSWLEYCFEENMTIENHPEVWQVDHVIALNCLKTKKVGDVEFEDNSDFSSLLIWYNTMPVLCKANQQKNKYLDTIQLASHLRRLESFLKKYKKSLDINVGDDFFNYKMIIRLVLDK
jgi:hypothetical protein